MDAVRKEVESFVWRELQSANKQFEMFHSNHEGYAVIKEEIEEVEQELNLVKYYLEDIWNCIKENDNPIELAKDLKRVSISMAVESIQVAAMAQKFVDSTDYRKENRNADKNTEQKRDNQYVCDGKYLYW